MHVWYLYIQCMYMMYVYGVCEHSIYIWCLYIKSVYGLCVRCVWGCMFPWDRDARRNTLIIKMYALFMTFTYTIHFLRLRKALLKASLHLESKEKGRRPT